MANSGDRKAPRVALVASSGMGHIGPMSLLAAALSSRGCDVSFVSAQPTVSQAETNRISQLLASFPTIQSLNLPLTEIDLPSNTDPFLRRFEAIIRSADNLPPLLASSDISALVVDISIAFTFIPIAKKMNLPCYVLGQSASMTAFCAYFPTYCSAIAEDAPLGDVDINGVLTVPKASIVPVLNNRNHLFTKQFIENGRWLTAADGIIVNSFDALEPEVVSGLKTGKIVPNLPPVVAIGPLVTFQPDVSLPLPSWLEQQPAGSVVFVSFGNRSAMTWQQTRELGLGLEMSGCRFLWVVKLTVVDRDEGEAERLNQVLGEGYLERVKDRAMVVNEWVEQTEVLRHAAVGGFFSHCGWNSVTESAMVGMRMLGWPRGGDHRVNGRVVRRSGLGVWMEEWSWEAEGGVVGRDEIAKAVKEMMGNETLRLSAARLGEEAAKAVGAGGSTDEGMKELVNKLKGAIAN